MKIKVGVIFGGNSVEHEVSIITAVQAMNHINQEKYDIVPIYISKDRIWYTGKMLMDIEIFKDFENLKKYAKKVMLVKTEKSFCLMKTNGLFRKIVTDLDIVLPIVHGKGVEDGSLAGLLESIGIPYAGPNILGASLGQDKVSQKQIMVAEGINTPSYTWFYDSEYLVDSKKILSEIKKLGYPVIVKPANLGSSVGISVAKKESEIEKAINEAIKYDNKILVEKMVDNLLEVNVSVLGNYEYATTSAIAEMITDNDFLTYEDKYISGGKKTGVKQSGKMSLSTMRIPAELDKETEEKVKDLALKTFRALNLSGVARIDFLINSQTKEVYVNEPNTIPGSLSFYLWEKVGKKYTELLDEIITMTIKDYKNQSKKITSFESNILSTFNGSKGLKGIKGKIGR